MTTSSRITRWRPWVAPILALAMWFAGNHAVLAHGGVIIGYGYTDQYQWLVLVSPYPVTPGETIVTLLVYGLNDSAPVTDLQADLLLKQPDEPDACCTAVQHFASVLASDPQLYPGDYSTTVTLSDVGRWEALFRIQSGADVISLTTPIDVVAAGFGGDAFVGESASITLTPMATGYVPVADGRTPPLSDGALARGGNPFGSAWWAWAIAAMAPVVGVFVWGLRPVEEERDEQIV